MGIGVFVYLPLLLIVGAAATFATVRGVSAEVLFRDPTAVLNAPLYVGALSTFGLFLWAAAAALCFFTAVLLWQSPAPLGERTFFLGAGVLTTALLLDDAFLFHESIAPDDLGWPGSVVVGGYAVAAVGLFWTHRRVVGDSAYSILGVSLGFLGASVGLDQLIDLGVLSVPWAATVPGAEFYLEDGTKLFGIAGWAAYFGWTGYRRVAMRMSRSFGAEEATAPVRAGRNGHAAASQTGGARAVDEPRPRAL
jgi:hypothetical protein